MQGSLFGSTPVIDAPATREARDGAIARAADHAAVGFREAAAAAIRRTAVTYSEFIVDDVWTQMDAHTRTHDNRAMGAEILRAVKAGWIEATERYTASNQKQNHGNPRRVWRSRIYGA